MPESRIVELDWSGAVTIGSLRLICTEARHFSGRGVARNTTLWSSWALIGPQHRVFLGGDTGYTPAFADIAAAESPFDLTVLPIGSYGKRWPYIHLTSEEAVQATRTSPMAVAIYRGDSWCRCIGRPSILAYTAGLNPHNDWWPRKGRACRWLSRGPGTALTPQHRLR